MNYLRRSSGLWLPDYHLRFPERRGFAQRRYNFLPGHFPAGAVAKAAEAGTTPFTTEWKSAGAGANDASVGDVAWSNPGNVTASDNSRADADFGLSTGTSEILRATDLGFTTGDVPNGATILGIEVGVERRDGGDTDEVFDFVMSLRTSSGQTGDNKADTGTSWPSGDTEVIYGGASDDWNAGLSDSDIRDPAFGVDLRVEVTVVSGALAEVDHFRIRVHGEA